jgi:hypothetical protein
LLCLLQPGGQGREGGVGGGVEAWDHDWDRWKGTVKGGTVKGVLGGGVEAWDHVWDRWKGDGEGGVGGRRGGLGPRLGSMEGGR